MGFKKDWDSDAIKHWIQIMAIEASSAYNDGWTQMSCKHDLYKLKCLIEDVYQKLHTFPGEEEWEKERVAELLKRK